MWQYINHSLDSINPAGIHIIRVFMRKNSTDECFFLQYKTLPDDSVIMATANTLIDLKNNLEQQQEVTE